MSGEAVLKGLNAVLAAATDVEAAKPALDGYALVVRLAGVLGLDALSETCVAGELPCFTPNIIGREGWCSIVSIASIASTGSKTDGSAESGTVFAAKCRPDKEVTVCIWYRFAE